MFWFVWKYGEYGGVGGSGDLDIVDLIMESLTVSLLSIFMILYLLRTVEESLAVSGQTSYLGRPHQSEASFSSGSFF
jgi:hypothetical protein